MNQKKKEERKQVIKEINKDTILETLAHIDRGYLPDWNYETHKGISLPNQYYPLHIAMQIAMKAIESQDDEFFITLDKEYTAKQER